MKMQVCSECGNTTWVAVSGPWLQREGLTDLSAQVNILCAKCGENGADLLWPSAVPDVASRAARLGNSD